MNILPKFEDVRKTAQTVEYKVLPVSCEILSDICTPIEAMKILKNVSTHCYMLESAQADEKWGRYTFLGYDPKMEITCMNGEMNAGESGSGQMIRPGISGRSLRITRVHALSIFRHLPEGWWDISPMTIWDTVSLLCGQRQKIPRRLKMWT